MKNILLITIGVASILAFGCGTKASSNKTNGATSNVETSAQTSNAQTSEANSGATNPKAENVAEAFIEMPSPNPVENAKKQSFTGIAVDVPADWKALKKFDSGTGSGIAFETPGDASSMVKLTIGRSYETVEGDVRTAFFKNVQTKLYSKMVLREIDGALGILSADLKTDGARDYLIWETFPPPDARGYAVRRYVHFSFPEGTYEQNKQRLADILLSAKIEK